MKKKISFDFHILPEHRRISGTIFPWRCIFNKNGDHPWGRCWPIYLESKQSLNGWIAVERAEITFISIHINAKQNSYHDDKSISFSAANLALAGIPLTNVVGENLPSRH